MVYPTSLPFLEAVKTIFVVFSKTQHHSPLFRLFPGELISGASNGAAGVGYPLRITLQNNALAAYDTTPSLENVSTICAFGEILQHRSLCHSGFEVIHNCTGAVEVLVSQCPGTRAVAACQVNIACQ